ncbi:MAG: TonB-dependent siderophore receptor [Ramlibacter sp.]
MTRNSLSPTAVALAAACLCQPAWAQDAIQTLPEVRVRSSADKETATSPVIGYRARNAATATKTDTPLAETPQAVTVITRDQLVDQGASNLQDALNYAAGVRSDAYGLDSRSDGARIRGAYPDEYQDGLRRLFDWYTSTTRVDPYLLERIEVLRGPSSMLFGQGTTGGVVNMVSKRPQAERQGEVGVQLGNFGRRQLQADLAGPLTADGQWQYRLVALGRQAGTQVDHVPDDRTLVAPTLAWRPNAVTSLTLQGLYQKDRSGSTSQFFPWQGVTQPNPNGPIPSNTFIGEPGLDKYDSERRSIGWLFEHSFAPDWTLRHNARISHNKVDYFSLYGDSFSVAGGWAADPVGQRMLGRYANFVVTDAKLTVTDQHLQGAFQTGAVRHQFLVGLDALRYRKDTRSFFDAPTYAGGGVPSIDVYNPVYGGYTPGPLARNPGSGLRQVGVYLQDQMRIGNWIVVAGLRHDRATNTLEGAPDDDTRATTRRLGVLYAMDNGWSPYLSYSESFTPVGGLDFFNRRFRPLRGRQLEAGVKYEPADRGLSFSAAVYKLEEKNQRVPDPANPLNTLQAGVTKNDGVELEFKGRLSATTELIAHYNYTNVDPALEGLPQHQAAVWGKWRFSIAGVPGFSVGAGVRSMSSFRDGAGPTVDAVALADGLLAYETASWRYALNVNNIADKRYASTCLGRGDCWFGARRTVIASATYRF